jgi:hypothetical protein
LKYPTNQKEIINAWRKILRNPMNFTISENDRLLDNSSEKENIDSYSKVYLNS